MRKLVCTAIAIMALQVTTGYGQTFYDLVLRDIDGNSINLKKFMGKKIMFLIIPLNGSDSLLLQLDSFLIQFSGSIKVIGIVSEEEGYNSTDKTALKELYKNRSILLTEPMKTRKGPQQSSLMLWLTDRRKNNHFNMDAQGVGHKFFVSETGRLFAVMPRRASLTNPMMSRIINSGRPRN